MKKFFTNIKDEVVFIYTEVKKSFSNEPSYFSSKRIERMLLFLTALTASNVWFWHKYPDLEYGEIIAYVSVHLGFAGYTMYQTEKSKKNLNQTEDDDNELDTDT